MVSTGTKVGLYTAAIGVPVLALLCTVGVIAFGIVGIEKAQDENPCKRANSSVECVTLATIGAPGGNDDDNDDIDLDEFYYWMAGTTAWGIVTAVVLTAAFVTVMEVVRKFHQLDKEEKERKKAGPREERLTSESKQPLASTESTDDHKQAADKLGTDETGTGDDDTDDDDVRVDSDVFGGHGYRPLRRHEIRPFTFPAVVAVFFSSLFAVGTLVSLLWGIALAYDHARRVDKDVDSFLAVELVLGVVMPLCLFIGGVLMAVVLEFITDGKLNAHKGINHFIPGVAFVIGLKRNYWVIDDTFYFPIKHHTTKTCFKTCDKTPATWLITASVCLTLLLSFSYFIDRTVVEARTVEDCDDVDTTYDCFAYDDGNFDYLDCEIDGVDDDVDDLHCFRFLRLGIDVNVIASISSAFAFYLVTVVVFSKIFSFVKILLHLKPSRFWGVGFILLGVILFIVGLALSIDGNILARLLSLNVIGVVHFLIVCVFLIIIGVLLVLGQWWEKVGVATKPRETHLVHYSDTTRGHIHKVEHEYYHEHPPGTSAQPTLSTTTTAI